ncbi:MAG: peptide chain release factor 2 [Actinobacteria bacterium]|nr:peptide chain release factor 2 [Actinomycetota bacterium]MCB9389108.1 peptide chain release factor 2 [Acidimicrobiia bacterium]
MADHRRTLDELLPRVSAASTYLNVDHARQRLAVLETEAARPDLWDNPENAKAVTSEMSGWRDDLAMVERLQGTVSDIETLLELADEEPDSGLDDEVATELGALATLLDELELRELFSQEHDERDAIVEINAGAGGTDAKDWAEMLYRMYLRWAERRGWQISVDDYQPGDEAGINSVTFTVKGRFAYGSMEAERGVHRLVRISPFDSQARRHTAFAAIDVVPALDQQSAPAIDEKELRIDTYRSSGAGGQHVNTTDSAVRITHLPTGTVVSCQNERSQRQNKERAMDILASRLAERARTERAAELSAIAGEKKEVGWGSQIRSYVLAPYQLVKDLRTGHETGNVSAVLDGALDDFVEEYLRWRRAGSIAGTGGEA